MSIWCADGSNVVDDDGNKECDNNHYFVADMHKGHDSYDLPGRFPPNSGLIPWPSTGNLAVLVASPKALASRLSPSLLASASKRSFRAAAVCLMALILSSLLGLTGEVALCWALARAWIGCIEVGSSEWILVDCRVWQGPTAVLAILCSASVNHKKVYEEHEPSHFP